VPLVLLLLLLLLRLRMLCTLQAPDGCVSH
jgi:hypothetical protein